VRRSPRASVVHGQKRLSRPGVSSWCRAPRRRGDIASSICLCPTAAVRPRIATISRRCSHCWKANWNLLSAARRKRSKQGRLSTSGQTRRICSTNPGRRFICSACAPSGQEEFFMPLGTQSAAGCRRRESLARKSKSRGAGSRRRCCQNTVLKCWRHDAGAWEPIEFETVLPRCLSIRLRLSSTELAMGEAGDNTLVGASVGDA
jgi:hypothetical protein